MAVDTLAKRSAALRYGRPGLATTRPPSGSINRFARAALLGCYSVTSDEFGVPTKGWKFGPDSTVWTFGPDNTVFVFGD